MEGRRIPMMITQTQNVNEQEKDVSKLYLKARVGMNECFGYFLEMCQKIFVCV